MQVLASSCTVLAGILAKVQCHLPFAAITTGADLSVAPENDVLYGARRHLGQEVRCRPPIAAISTGADRGNAGEGDMLQCNWWWCPVALCTQPCCPECPTSAANRRHRHSSCFRQSLSPAMRRWRCAPRRFQPSRPAGPVQFATLHSSGKRHRQRCSDGVALRGAPRGLVSMPMSILILPASAAASDASDGVTLPGALSHLDQQAHCQT